MVREILLLGDPRLYQVSSPVERGEIDTLKEVVHDLHDTLIAFRKKYGAGRAIAAPQIGVFKRIIYMCIDEPVVFINPILQFEDDEMMEVLDDSMSFPGLLVRVKRFVEAKTAFGLAGCPAAVSLTGLQQQTAAGWLHHGPRQKARPERNL